MNAKLFRVIALVAICIVWLSPLPAQAIDQGLVPDNAALSSMTPFGRPVEVHRLKKPNAPFEEYYFLPFERPEMEEPGPASNENWC